MYQEWGDILRPYLRINVQEIARRDSGLDQKEGPSTLAFTLSHSSPTTNSPDTMSRVPSVHK